ncbi:MAG: hypothetical protein H0X24_04155 [Ktedonobacterales bacterium]|nr:hypothetical protein [Ktedonobacterales bacterium]
MSELPLPLRPLGQTGLLVPPLCIGLAELGNMPETFAYEVTEAEALDFLRALFHGPIPFADTAASYGDGESERILAKGPRAYPRYMYGDASDDLIQLAFGIEALYQAYEVPLAAAALQFSLRDPRIAATIVGVSKTERLHQTVELAQHPIPEALWQAITALRDAHGRA